MMKHYENEIGKAEQRNAQRRRNLTVHLQNKKEADVEYRTYLKFLAQVNEALIRKDEVTVIHLD
jgi:hypothetical protein